MVIPPGFSRPVGITLIAHRVELDEGVEILSRPVKVSLLVQASAIGHFDCVCSRRVRWVLHIFGPEFQLAVRVFEKGGAKLTEAASAGIFSEIRYLSNPLVLSKPEK